MPRARRPGSRRPAVHAGGAYPGEATELSSWLDELLEARPAPSRRLVGVVAPHVDYWRAHEAYGVAYGALARGLDPRTETVVVLGTVHAGMRSPFALSRADYDTPLGKLETDASFVDELCAGSRFDPLADEGAHEEEHSIELQAVFLRHLLAERAPRARIVPILCGLGRQQLRRSDPRRDADAESFSAALEEAVARRRGRVLVVAGADLAHVGPTFGDPAPLDAAGRRSLAARDRASCAHLTALDPEALFAHTTEDLAERRVCSAAPLYTFVRAARAAGATPGGGRELGYTQHVDPDDGSVVSHVTAAFEAS